MSLPMTSRLVALAGATGREDEAPSLHLSRWFANHAIACLFLSAQTLEVLDANAAAIRLVDASDELALSGGKLVVRGKAAAEQFRRFVCSLDGAPEIHMVGDHHRPLLMRVERVDETDVIAVQLFPIAQDEDQGLWANMGVIFGLTPSEDRLIKLLVGGANIKTLSEDLGISVETARTHVRRSYLKIGVSNREQLFAAVAPYRLKG